MSVDPNENREERERVLRSIADRIEACLEQLEGDVEVLEEYGSIYAGLLGKSCEALKNDKALILAGANAIARRRAQIEQARTKALAEQAWSTGVRS